MTDLVESVARAIIRKRAGNGDDLGPPLSGPALEQHVNEAWKYWKGDARAAILAVLEGISHPAMHKKIIDEHGAAPVVDFQKMIDHIKAEIE